MKILFVSERFPFPLNDGGNLRTYHVLQGLARAHEVHVLAHRPARSDSNALAKAVAPCPVTLVEREPIAWRALQAMASGRALFQPLFIVKNWSSSLLKSADQLLARDRFDAIHFNHLDTACYALKRKWPQLAIVDTHNCLSAMAQERAGAAPNVIARQLRTREAGRLKRTEQSVCRRMDLVLTCSNEESRRFTQLAGRDNCITAPNGVDCDRFSEVSGQSVEPGAIVFVGSMSYFPNREAAQHFCEKVLPKIMDLEPRPRFYLVGKDPPAAVRKLHNGKNVVVTGEVPDTRPYLERAQAVVVPLLSGAGTRLKILEAFAAGKAVISTSKGAEGIEAVPGRDILLADCPEQFAQHIRTLWRKTARVKELGLAAQSLARRQYSWQSIQDKILGAYGELELKRGNTGSSIPHCLHSRD